MAPNHEQIVSQALSKRYHNVETTKRDTLNALSHYRGLSPKLDKFVFNDGTERELLKIGGTIPVQYKVFCSGTSRYLLCLDGTIPVTYKGSVYNIPICIWLLDNHPLSAPMVFVTPTSDMLIKASRHVDQSGKVYLPYLHEWNPNSSDLLGLIQIMIITFGELPPVYAKTKSSQSQSSYSTPYPTQPPGYMPVPTGSTPYPPVSTSPFPYPSYPNSQNYISASSPYPMYPGSTPYPNPSNAPPPYPVGSGLFPTTADSSAVPVSSAGNTGTITEEHIRASLISAVSDRVRAKLRECYGESQAEISVLRQQQSDLNQGKVKLENLMSKMEQEKAELDKTLKILQEKEVELKSILSRLPSDNEPLDIDEAVTTTAPLYKQLLNAYAEDQAIQDAIYYLGEALRRDIIDLDTFLKHIRSLSRRQFELRAVMSKCRTRANLCA